jgi:hypothetical protein
VPLMVWAESAQEDRARETGSSSDRTF